MWKNIWLIKLSFNVEKSNDCVANINGKATTMMEWLAAQSLNGNVSNMN